MHKCIIEKYSTLLESKDLSVNATPYLLEQCAKLCKSDKTSNQMESHYLKAKRVFNSWHNKSRYHISFLRVTDPLGWDTLSEQVESVFKVLHFLGGDDSTVRFRWLQIPKNTDQAFSSKSVHKDVICISIFRNISDCYTIPRYCQQYLRDKAKTGAVHHFRRSRKCSCRRALQRISSQPLWNHCDKLSSAFSWRICIYHKC